MFSQLVSNALPEGAVTRSIGSQTTIERQFDETVAAAIVDLAMAIDVDWLVAVAQKNGAKLIGVASHVHVGRIAAAKAAGFDQVLTRSQVAEKLRETLA